MGERKGDEGRLQERLVKAEEEFEHVMANYSFSVADAQTCQSCVIECGRSRTMLWQTSRASCRKGSRARRRSGRERRGSHKGNQQEEGKEEQEKAREGGEKEGRGGKEYDFMATFFIALHDLPPWVSKNE
eukprot:766407-Hanusia_phi.AAC.3